MRKATLTFVLVLFLSMFFTIAVFSQQALVANKAFIIDFGYYKERVRVQFETNKVIRQQLEAKRQKQKLPPRNTGVPTEDPKYMPDPADWALAKWEIELNSSASSVKNNVMSYVKPVKSGFWQRNKNTFYDTLGVAGYAKNTTDIVLGARIHFPTHRQNCWAKIHPPFEIYAYDDNGKLANLYNGVVDNVGQIKSISVWVKGRNYPNGLAVRLKDRQGIEKEYYFGSLGFHNWRQLTWKNPNYIEDPKDRLLVRLPLYPRSRPFIKFVSFIVYRHMDALGGDFIIYIRDLKMSYDKSIAEEDKTDIDDEDQWGILARRRMKAKERELLKLAEKKVLLERENQKFKQLKTRGVN